MIADRSRRYQPWLIAMAVALVLLGAYAGGYFWLGEYEENPPGDPSLCRHWRTYEVGFLAKVFVPMAWAECRIRRESLTLEWQDEGTPFGYDSIEFAPH